MLQDLDKHAKSANRLQLLVIRQDFFNYLKKCFEYMDEIRIAVPPVAGEIMPLSDIEEFTDSICEVVEYNGFRVRFGVPDKQKLESMYYKHISSNLELKTGTITRMDFEIIKEKIRLGEIVISV